MRKRLLALIGINLVVLVAGLSAAQAQTYGRVCGTAGPDPFGSFQIQNGRTQHSGYGYSNPHGFGGGYRYSAPNYERSYAGSYQNGALNGSYGYRNGRISQGGHGSIGNGVVQGGAYRSNGMYTFSADDQYRGNGFTQNRVYSDRFVQAGRTQGFSNGRYNESYRVKTPLGTASAGVSVGMNGGSIKVGGMKIGW